LIIDYFLLIILAQRLFTESNPGCFTRRTGHNSRAADAPSAFGVFTAHKMTTAGALALDLTRSGNLDSFAQPLMGLLFRHLANPFIKETI
jgi:hypothetical protein